MHTHTRKESQRSFHEAGFDAYCVGFGEHIAILIVYAENASVWHGYTHSYPHTITIMKDFKPFQPIKQVSQGD